MGQSTGMRQRGGRSAQRRGCRGWIGPLLGGLASLLITVLLAGALYQMLASQHDLRQHPPPGELIGVGDHRLHIYCLGHKQVGGSPTVVLEAGQGDNWLDWSPVQEQIAALAQVCAYDRAGLGWSDPVSSPVPSSQVAKSLRTLLHNARIEGPYILVGHSFGGFYARAFASLAPDEVAALVLLDSSHENQDVRLPAEFVALEDPDMWLLHICRLAAPIGLVRLVKGMDDYAAELPYGPEQREIYLATMYRTHYCRTQLNEQAPGIVDAKEPALPASLGDVPLVVLSAGANWSEDPDEFPPGATAEMLTGAYATWLDLQRELAALSTRGVHQIAGESGHYIHHDQPDLVVDIMRQVVESVQRR